MTAAACRPLCSTYSNHCCHCSTDCNISHICLLNLLSPGLCGSPCPPNSWALIAFLAWCSWPTPKAGFCWFCYPCQLGNWGPCLEHLRGVHGLTCACSFFLFSSNMLSKSGTGYQSACIYCTAHCLFVIKCFSFLFVYLLWIINC